jgi:hypothetical protein
MNVARVRREWELKSSVVVQTLRRVSTSAEERGQSTGERRGYSPKKRMKHGTRHVRGCETNDRRKRLDIGGGSGKGNSGGSGVSNLMDVENITTGWTDNG